MRKVLTKAANGAVTRNRPNIPGSVNAIFRISKTDKKIIQEAARRVGVTASLFMYNASMKAAQEVMENKQVKSS